MMMGADGVTNSGDGQRQLNALRSALRECSPGALVAFSIDLASRDAPAILAIAPTPELGRGCRDPRLSQQCEKVAVNAVSNAGPRRSRGSCGPNGSRRHS